MDAEQQAGDVAVGGKRNEEGVVNALYLMALLGRQRRQPGLRSIAGLEFALHVGDRYVCFFDDLAK